MRRLRWVAVAATLAICSGAPPGAAAAPLSTHRAAPAAKKKPRKRHKKAPVSCKPGQARLHIGKRTVCVTHSLPAAHQSPQAATVATALNLELGTARDRRGRRAPSLAKLLARAGPQARPSLERGIASGLAKAEALQAAQAKIARTRVSLRARATDSGCSGSSSPGALPGSSSAKVGEATVSLDVEGGAMKLGIDIKAKGIGIEANIRSCGEAALNIDGCPTAEGKVEGHGHAELEASFKVTEGGKLVLAKGFRFSGETTVKAQTGDDAKLDGYDIKHIYKMVGSFGGSKAAFGPITVDTTYIGEAHINLRSAGGAPPPAQVDVMMSMAGVDPAERIAAEIKVARETQASADKEFADEIDKATKQLQTQERHWLTPNECASMHFEPGSESIKLKKGQTGTVKSRIEAKAGGAPAAASWTLGGQQNATFTPGGSEGNPLSTSYTVTKAMGAVVSATFKATSRAGVAEAPWKQQTEHITEVIGTFSGRFDDHSEVIEWTGSAIFVAIEQVAGGTILKLSSGSVTAKASGETDFECSQTGEESVPLFVGSTFSVETLGESIVYQIDAGWGFPGRMKATLFGCAESSEDGMPYDPDLGNWAVLSGDVLHNGVSDLIKVSPDGTTFDGSATATGTEPSEKYSWSWSFKGS